MKTIYAQLQQEVTPMPSSAVPCERFGDRMRPGLGEQDNELDDEQPVRVQGPEQP